MARTTTARTRHGRLLLGDCLRLLKKQRSCSVDLIVTSPPYGDNRKTTYSGVRATEYVQWFLPIAEQMKRVLKDDGSLVLNLKERVTNGERGTYVLELILALRAQGWLWTEEYIWHKKNSYPGKWPNRFRDAWERCLHFTKQRHFQMYQDEVKVPLGSWAETRLATSRPYDQVRQQSKVGSPFSKKVSNWVGRSHVYPTNVLVLATESRNRGHSAAFPIALPEHFIRLFTKTNDLVLDPFMGSGTTAIASIKLQRRYVGIEISRTYFRVAQEAVVQAAGRPTKARASTPQTKKPPTSGHSRSGGSRPTAAAARSR